MDMKFFRVDNEIPLEPEASAIYLVRNQTSGDLEIAAVNSAGTASIKTLTRADVEGMLASIGAGEADQLSTARNISMSGDVTWTVSFDGSANVSAAGTLASTGVTPGEYPVVTVDAKGRVTEGRALTGADIGRDEANGVAPLNAQSKVPTTNLITNTANGVALLDGTGKILMNQIYTDVADGVPKINGNGKILASLIPVNEANAVAGLDENGRLTNAVLPIRRDVGGTPYYTGFVVNVGANGKLDSDLIDTNVNNGILRLDGNGKAAVAQLPINTANGIAGLDANSKVANANLPRGDASGIAPLDANSKVPVANLPVDEANGISSLDENGFVPMANLKTNTSLGLLVLDGDGLVPESALSFMQDGLIKAENLPSFVDDVIEVDDYDKLPGEVNDPGTNGAPSKGKIYVVTDDVGGTQTVYRWSGTVYIEIPTGVGVADSAVKLSTARSIGITGDATWSVTFDGSANVSAALTLAASGVTGGVYGNITVDSKGRITSIRELEAGDIPTLTWETVQSAASVYVPTPAW